MTSPVTAEQLANYSKLHDEAVEKVISIINDPKWELNKEDKDIVFYKRFEESSPFAQIKSIVTIPGTTLQEVKEILTPIVKVDENTPEKERHGLDYCYELPGSGEGYNLFVTATKSPGMMVSGREFVLYRKIVEKDGLLIAISVSIPDDSIVPVGKGHVRGVMTQGYVAKVSPKNDKDVELSFFVHADPKGSIPAIAYNQVVTSQGYAAKGIRNKIIKLHEGK